MTINKRNLTAITCGILAVLFIVALAYECTQLAGAIESTITPDTTFEETTSVVQQSDYSVLSIQYYDAHDAESNPMVISGAYIPSDIARAAIQYYQNAEFTTYTGTPDCFYEFSLNDKMSDGTHTLYMSTNDSEQPYGNGVLLTNENGYSMWCPRADYPELKTFYYQKLRLMRFNMMAETQDDYSYAHTTFTSSQMSSLQSHEVPNILAAFALRFGYYSYFKPEETEINFDEQSITSIGTFHFSGNVQYEVTVEFVYNSDRDVQGIICVVHHTGTPHDLLKEDNRSYYAFDRYPEAEYLYNMLLTYISPGTEDAKMFFDT